VRYSFYFGSGLGLELELEFIVERCWGWVFDSLKGRLEMEFVK